MLIRNIRVNDNVDPQSIYIDDSGEYQTSSKGLPAGTVFIDSEGHYSLLPGLFDTHIHGINGFDFTDATLESISGITEKLGEIGVSYCLATLASLELTRLKNTLKVINQYVDEQEKHQQPGAAKIMGVHLEGPFIAKNCKGAHDENVLQSEISFEMFKDIISVAPSIREWKITLAPEIKGGIEFIWQAKAMKNENLHITVFIGHTNADPDIIKAALEAGAVGFTHLGNANCETAQRCQHIIGDADIQSNVVRSAFSNKVMSELIVDGEHLSPDFVRYAIKQLGNNIILVSDLLNAAFKPEDEIFMLGTLGVMRKGNKIVLVDNNEKMAGSATPLSSMIQILFSMLKEDKPLDEINNIIYHAAILNPRFFHSAVNFSDNKNFIIINNKSGEVVLHSCNGKLFIREPELKEKFSQSSSHFFSGFKNNMTETGMLNNEAQAPSYKQV